MAFDLDDEELEATRKLHGVRNKMSVEEAKAELKEYITRDPIYKDYLEGKPTPSDFDKFCIKHCEAIDIVLKNLEFREFENTLFYLPSSYRNKIKMNKNNKNCFKKEN